MMLDFCTRPTRDLEKAHQFAVGPAPASFGDVRTDRNCGTTQLACQTVNLFFRKTARLLIFGKPRDCSYIEIVNWRAFCQTFKSLKSFNAASHLTILARSQQLAAKSFLQNSSP